MQTDSTTTATSTNHSDEQTFGQWASKRLALYQTMEQQAQASIAQTLQMASELTLKMEEEANQLLARYRQEREAHQTQLEALRNELEAARATMAEERQAHQDTLNAMRQQEETQLAQRRQQEETQLAQRRQQAAAEAEQQLASANAERTQLLRQAYAERDRVVAETRQLSGRLAELQQALQGLLGVVGSAQGAGQILQTTSSQNPYPVEAVAEPQPGAQTAPTAPFSAATTQPTDTAAPQAAAAGTNPRWVVEDVPSFTLASDIIDRLEQSESVASVQLLQYEEATLVLSVQPAANDPIDTMIQDDFGDLLEIVEAGQHEIRLRARS